MYKIAEELQQELKDFYLPFGGSLDEPNRWVRLAAIIRWDEIEKRYARQFSKEMGAPAKRSRMALGALIIKQRLRISDDETLEQIRENPYLQFFLGLSGFTNEMPFDASMMVYFRKRFGAKTLGEINELLIAEKKQEIVEDEKPEKPKKKDPPNQGQLILDASCVPQDIRHPTDLGLTNDARLATEEIIDILHSARNSAEKKPRTYRECARRDYLRCVKKRRLGMKEFYKGRKKQLQYLARNLRSIKKLLEEVELSGLPHRSYRGLLVATEILRQQTEMQPKKQHSIEGRIVSLAQPHVRPIVRGKARTAVRVRSEDLGECGRRVHLCGSHKLGCLQRRRRSARTDRSISQTLWPISGIGTCGQDLPDTRQPCLLQSARNPDERSAARATIGGSGDSEIRSTSNPGR